MNREQVFEVLEFLRDVYPNFNIAQSKIDNWTKLLKDQDPVVIMRNAEHYALDNKFPPTLTDLREVKQEAFSNDFLNKLERWEREAVGRKP